MLCFWCCFARFFNCRCYINQNYTPTKVSVLTCWHYMFVSSNLKLTYNISSSNCCLYFLTILILKELIHIKVPFPCTSIFNFVWLLYVKFIAQLLNYALYLSMFYWLYNSVELFFENQYEVRKVFLKWKHETRKFNSHLKMTFLVF